MKNTLKLVFIIALELAPFINGFGTECKRMNLDEARRKNYEISNSVFLGIPISIENNIAKFVVVDQFKGEDIKEAFVNLSNYPKDKQFLFSLWLIYANKIKESDTLFITDCSISRSIEDPFIIVVHSLPPPIGEDEAQNSEMILLSDMINKVYLNLWRNDFYDEIEILKNIGNSTNRSEKSNNIVISSTAVNCFIYVVITILFLLLILSCYLILKIRKLEKSYK